MEEIAKIVSNYGVGIIIVVLFIYDWITNKKKISDTLTQNEKCLHEISKSSENTATSLKLLQQTMDDQRRILIKHDKRCEDTQKMVELIKNEIESKG